MSKPLNMYYDAQYPLNNGITFYQPIVQEVLDIGENLYFRLINLFLIYPVDLIVELYDMGYSDYDVFSCYDIFIMLFSSDQQGYSNLIKFLLGDVDLHLAVNKQTDARVLYDNKRDIVFDEETYKMMSAIIKSMHHIPEDVSKTAKKSKALKRVLIETERIRKNHEASQQKDGLINSGQLNSLITKMTVVSQFRRKELLNMRVYEFYQVVKEVVEFYYWKYMMFGIYTGNIDAKKYRNETNYFYK